MLAVLVLVAAFMAACGDDGGAPKGGSSQGAASSYQQFAACMREHGQDVPDQDPDSGNVVITPPAANGAWDTAMSACRHFLPDGGEAGAVTPQQLEGLRAYAVCMREHGVELTDPDPTTGKSQFGGRLANATRDQIVNDPTYKAADAACKDRLGNSGAPKGGGK
ncbi:hypothetical protein GCM10010532_041280 [Dactylosporangium siamense]|uniref:Uncharacterized protein n=2 Tax=Dactylosporangium siamense TaxID=685454 RepID=A0A919PS38_9ACTN|nr:hypothetical protein Dsi01nite_071400 [Dactylosporangium siamense]